MRKSYFITLAALILNVAIVNIALAKEMCPNDMTLAAGNWQALGWKLFNGDGTDATLAQEVALKRNPSYFLGAKWSENLQPKGQCFYQIFGHFNWKVFLGKEVAKPTSKEWIWPDSNTAECLKGLINCQFG